MSSLSAVPAIVNNMRRNQEAAALAEAYDPIKAGFKDYDEYPLQTRARVIKGIFEVALQDEEIAPQLITDYSEAIAKAAVATAGSTGLTDVTTSLLYRSLNRHYRHETEERLEGHLLTLRHEIVGVQASRGDRLKAYKALHGLAFGDEKLHLQRGPGLIYPQSIEYADPNLDDSVIRAAKRVTHADVRLDDLDEALAQIQEGTAVPAHTIVLSGLRALGPRIERELGYMQSAVQAVRTVLPEFGQREAWVPVQYLQ